MEGGPHQASQRIGLMKPRPTEGPWHSPSIELGRHCLLAPRAPSCGTQRQLRPPCPPCPTCRRPRRSPVHNSQAISRIWRYGQQRPCFIYRLFYKVCVWGVGRGCGGVFCGAWGGVCEAHEGRMECGVVRWGGMGWSCGGGMSQWGLKGSSGGGGGGGLEGWVGPPIPQPTPDSPPTHPLAPLPPCAAGQATLEERVYERTLLKEELFQRVGRICIHIYVYDTLNCFCMCLWNACTRGAAVLKGVERGRAFATRHAVQGSGGAGAGAGTARARSLRCPSCIHLLIPAMPS